MIGQQIQHPLPTQRGIHRRLVMGWLGKGMGLSITFSEQILLVPVFLTIWGPERYGDWLVLLSAAGSVALLDTGLQTYYANAMQASLAKGDPEFFKRLLHQGTALYAAIIIAALPLIIIGAAYLPWADMLNLTVAGPGPAGNIILILALYFLMSLPFGMANAVYRAHGHFATSIMVGNLARLGLISAIALSLWAGATPVALGLIYCTVMVASWAALLAHQRHRYPELRYGLSWPDQHALKGLFSVAPFYAAIPAAKLVTTHATIIMISSLASAGAAVVAYATLRTLTGIARMVVDQIMHVTGVEIARQFAERDQRALTTLYGFIARLSGGICGALAGLIAVIGQPFLAIWTIGKVPFDAGIFWPLLATAGLAGPSVAGVSVLLFINRPAGMAGAYAVSAAVTLCLCLLLIPAYGTAGAAWSVLIAEVAVLSTMIPAQTAKVIGGSAIRLILHIQGIALLCFVVSGTGAWLALWLADGGSLPGLAATGLVWAALAAPPLYFLMINRDRRRWIAERLREKSGR